MKQLPRSDPAPPAGGKLSRWVVERRYQRDSVRFDCRESLRNGFSSRPGTIARYSSLSPRYSYL